MLDRWRPATALLAATCLWAVALLVLALTGLGGRVAPLPDDATGVPELPVVRLAPVKPRLGDATQYGEVGARPLLINNRRPVPVGPVPGEGADNDLDVSLTSVLITPRLQMAILTDNTGGASKRVRQGEAVPGTSWTLVEVQPRSALLEGPGGQRSLELRVYNGLGGAAPTAMTPDAAAPDPGQPAEATPAEIPANAAPIAGTPPPPPAPQQPAETMTQEQQIEAIRRRIEARHAQMRAEAARTADDKR